MRTIVSERVSHDRTAAHAPAWAALVGELATAPAVDEGDVVDHPPQSVEQAL
jgi:hypothetical protein